jgi:hypothetical protein
MYRLNMRCVGHHAGKGSVSRTASHPPIKAKAIGRSDGYDSNMLYARFKMITSAYMYSTVYIYFWYTQCRDILFRLHPFESR